MVRWPVVMGCVFALGCGTKGGTTAFAPNDGGDDGGAFPSPDATVGDDGSGGGGTPHSCNPTSADLEGCACPQAGATRACYTGDPKTRDVGTCKDGAQTCLTPNEFPVWGPCTGSVTPAPEVCDSNVDRNCNGKTGCNDPTCVETPLCNTGCTDGQTRACYDGPSGTENVGTCKDGTQTCVNGHWPSTCTGEVLPQPENCCDAVDHNCNGLAGCYDLFSCVTASCCQSSCDAGGPVDPGCVCMTGSGDTATCPKGDHYVHKGGLPGTDECCPCTASDCGTPNCCDEDVCRGSSACSGLTCTPLPSSCNGNVSADCDDFPEDCDEPCCECTQGC